MNAGALVAVVVIVVSAAGAVVVGAMFIWAARKDGEEDVALQKKLGTAPEDSALNQLVQAALRVTACSTRFRPSCLAR